MSFELVTSPANPLLKDIRKAQEQGALTSQGWMVAEGPRLVEEVMRSGLRIHCAIYSQGSDLPAGIEALRVLELPPATFRSISGTETPQGILVLVEPPPPRAYSKMEQLIVILDGVQDPGNAGSIARSAEAFGATGMVFIASASPFSPKVLRAAAGSLFRIPFQRASRDFACGVPFFAGVADLAAPAPWQCDFLQPCAIVVGSEGQGISEQLRVRSQPVRIPTAGVESLNAAVAGSVLLYEAARQRTPK